MQTDNAQKMVIVSAMVPEQTLRKATFMAMQVTGEPVMLDGDVTTLALEMLAGQHTTPFSMDVLTEATSEHSPRIFEWHSDGWMVELPVGTLLLFPYQKKEFVAEVDKDGKLKYQGEVIEPGEFVRRLAGTSRNARGSLRVMRPGDAGFSPAKDLFDTVAKKSNRVRERQNGPDILYKDFVAALDKLRDVGFPDAMFRDLHHKGSSIDGMRRYALLGIEAGNEKARCKWDSRNGRVYRRIQEILQHATKGMQKEELHKLVDDAIEKVPFLD
jgi:hypothetical protein